MYIREWGHRKGGDSLGQLIWGGLCTINRVAPGATEKLVDTPDSRFGHAAPDIYDHETHRL